MPIVTEDVVAEIGMIMQQVNVLGANDHELPTLRRILDSFRGGEIGPEDALAQAREVLESKQDYH